MIKKLRKDFIFIMMISLFLVMTVLLSIINILYYYNTVKEANYTMEILYENSGRFPNDMEIYEKDPSIHEFQQDMENKSVDTSESPTISPNEPEEPNAVSSLFNFFDFHWTQDTKFETSFFIVELDSDNNITDISHAYIASVSEDDIADYSEQIVSLGKTKGRIENFVYNVYKENNNSTKIIAINCYQQFRRSKMLIIASIAAGILCMAAVFLLILFMSKKVTKTAEESINKQRQFITDAGHELKTPITIISANVDVLQLQNGSNQFTDSIKKQTKRLSSLVTSLLELSKLNEGNDSIVLSEVLLSSLVENSSESFVTLAESNNKNIELYIEPDITINGIRSELDRLVSVLLDNAIKYSDGVSPIRISLTKQRSKVLLAVGNSCEHIEEQNLDKLFQRFYRLDASRSRKTGGNGIGLSIAGAIMEHHKGIIKAETSNNGNYLTITASFPSK